MQQNYQCRKRSHCYSEIVRVVEFDSPVCENDRVGIHKSLCS